LNPDGVTKPFGEAGGLFYFETRRTCSPQLRNKKDPGREAHWRDLGKANAKWIIKNNPDGVTTDFEAQVVTWDRGQKGDF
jgi:hypothetical protein